jgi:peptide/nickel transport system permease protein
MASRKPPLGSWSMVFAAVILALILSLIIIVPFLPRYDAFSQDIFSGLLRPGSTVEGRTYWLGTDILGRDILSRLALAGRVSLAIAISAVVISLFFGVTLGLLAGYFRGLTENVVMGIADLQLAVPRILLVIAVTAVLGPDLVTLTILLGLTSWVSYGRVARAMALSLREREFVLSAITQGAGAAWNIRKHLLPNVLPQMLILASYELGQIIVIEAALSYLGLGVQPPMPSWGLMINEGQDWLEVEPWLAIIPGVAIFMLVAGAQFLSQRFTPEGAQDKDITAIRSRT